MNDAGVEFANNRKRALSRLATRDHESALRSCMHLFSAIYFGAHHTVVQHSRLHRADLVT